MKTTDLLLALLAIALWSSNLISLKIGLLTTSVETFNLARFGLCLPLLFFVKRPQMGLFPLCLIALFFNVLNFWFVGKSLLHGTSVGVAAFLFQTSVFFGVLFSYVLNKEVPTVNQMVGCLISFSGVFLLSYSTIEGMGSLRGVLESLLSAICWGIGFALIKKYKADSNAALVVWMTGISFFILLGLDALFGGQGLIGLPRLSLQGLGSAFYALVLSSLLGGTLWCHLSREYSASLLGSFIFLMPLFSILFGYIIFFEKVSKIQLIGGTIIIFGLLVSQIRLKKWSMTLKQSR